VIFFDDFHSKLTIFSAFCHVFRTILTQSGKKQSKHYGPKIWIFDQKFLFSKLLFVAYFDQNRLDFALFYEIRSQKSKIH
jgi:hypothetical protein